MRLYSVAMSLALAGLCSTGGTEPTRVEITHEPGPSDSTPNSDAVPEAYALGGRFQRVVVARVKHRADLLAGLESVVREQRLVNAVILSGIGSVRGYHVHVVGNRDFPSKNVFVKDPNAPADILNVNGYVVGGRIHAHVTLADDHQAFGGHLEPGTEVFTFAIVTLGVLDDDVDLSRVDDSSYR